MPACTAIGCYNHSDKRGRGGNVPPDVSFHGFPLGQPHLLKQWVHNLGRKDFIPNKNSRLCSVHFLPNCFFESKKRRLRDGAVPTVFEHRQPQQQQQQLSAERAERQKRRAQMIPPTTYTATKKSRRVETVTREMIDLEEMEKESSPESPHAVQHVDLPTQEVSIEGISEAPSTGVQKEFLFPVEILPTLPLVELPMSPLEGPSGHRPKVPLAESHTFAQAMSEELVAPLEIMSTKAPIELPIPPPIGYMQQPQYAVHSVMGTPMRTRKDHPYAHSRPVRSIGTQTFREAEEPKDVPSSPFSSPLRSEEFEELSDFQPLPESSSNEEASSSSPEEGQKSGSKFLVFEESLRELLKFCKKCGSPFTQVTKFTKGSMVGFKVCCHASHSYTWHSQPLERKQPLGNLLISAAILICGGTYAKFKSFADTLGLQFFSKTVFNIIQKSYVLPVIQESWEKERKKAVEEVKAVSSVVLGGDGRCDSPGHCAKYGSYTLMHTDGEGQKGTRKIVSMKLVQVSEVKNSNHMEPEGLKRCLEELKKEEVEVGILATDRHLMISSIMKTQYKKIDHQYDVWHVGKGIVKKLTAKAKTKECVGLSEWIQSISNHLWWACGSCDQNEQLLREKWMSILHHVTNNHKWSGNTVFHCCQHPPITNEDERIVKWLKPTSPAFMAIKKVVTDPRLLKALSQLTKFCHTGELEVFHSMLLKYCPKRQHFHYDSMTGRLMLAALEWNSTRREKLIDQHGKAATSVTYSKQRKTFVLKNRYSKIKPNYTDEMMERVREVHNFNIKLPAIVKPELPKHVAPIPKPDKEQLEEKFRSRFK